MKYTNKHDISIAMAVFLANDDYDGYGEDVEGKYISVTSLLKSDRQIVLSKRMEPSDGITDVADLLASRLGQAIHGAIEMAWINNHKQCLIDLGYPAPVYEGVLINPDPSKVTEDDIPIYLEQRNSRKILDWTISGKYDMVINGVVTDVKSTGTYTYMKQTNADKYPLQGSLYRWLNPEIITEDYMNIEYLFKDWSKNLSMSTKGYPKLPVLQQSYPLMDLAKTELWIKEKLNRINLLLDKPEPELPHCTPEELWQSAPVYKYYKDKSKAQVPGARSTKNFDTFHEANERYLKDKSVGIVVEKPGEPVACKYCQVSGLCTQKDKYIAAGVLKL